MSAKKAAQSESKSVEESSSKREGFATWREMSAALHGLAVIADQFERQYAAAGDDAMAAEADHYITLTKTIGTRLRVWRDAVWDANGGFDAQIEAARKSATRATVYYDNVIPEPEQPEAQA